MRRIVSFDSDPEPVKKKWLNCFGVTSVKSRDISTTAGWVVLKKVL